MRTTSLRPTRITLRLTTSLNNSVCPKQPHSRSYRLKKTSGNVPMHSVMTERYPMLTAPANCPRLPRKLRVVSRLFSAKADLRLTSRALAIGYRNYVHRQSNECVSHDASGAECGV